MTIPWSCLVAVMDRLVDRLSTNASLDEIRSHEAEISGLRHATASIKHIELAGFAKTPYSKSKKSAFTEKPLS
jgi:hypothetical protein